MAAKRYYRQGFLLLLFNFISATTLDKRFSDFKRCTDKECSMLLCRGKAVKDFSGPDCRFLSFKKSETIYVYYKLSGRRADLWAGSVGSHFGYFPKHILAVNHLYSDKELEVPAEETDFVCFDTGFDKFDNYDIDLLLGSSIEENDSAGHMQEPEDTLKETETEVASDIENPAELDDEPGEVDRGPDSPSSSLPKLEVATEHLATKVVEAHTTPDTTEDLELENTVDSVLLNDVSESAETKDTFSISKVESVPEDEKKKEDENKAVSVTEGVQIPELKTTFGSTFDAVTTDEEITKNVTPYEEEETKDVRTHPGDYVNVKEETPLLSFSRESAKTLEFDTFKQQASPPRAHDRKPNAADENNVQTSHRDTAFSVVTEVETTAQDFSFEEDDGDDEEEEAVARTHSSFEEAMDDLDEPITTESPEEPENIDQVLQDPSETSSVQSHNKETVSDSRELLLHSEDESDGEVMKHENDLDETLLPIDDAAESDRHQTNHQTQSDQFLQDHILDIPEAKKSDVKKTHKPPTEDNEEEEATSDSEIIEDVEDTQDSGVAVDHREDFNEAFDEHKINTYQQLVITERENLKASDKMRSRDLDEENIVDDSLSGQIHEPLVKDDENIVDDSLSSQIHEPFVKDDENIVDDNLSGQIQEPLVKDDEIIVDDSLSGQIHELLVKDNENIVGDSLSNQIHEPLVKDDENIVGDSLSNQIHEPLVKDDENIVDDSLSGQIHEPFVKDDENIVDDSLSGQIHEPLVKDDENKVDDSLSGENNNPLVENEERIEDDSLHGQISHSSVTGLERNIQPELSVEQPDIPEELYTEEREDNDTEMEEHKNKAKEELLEDENALSFSQNTESDKPTPKRETVPPESTPEPEYSDSVMRLTLLRDQFTEEYITRFQNLLGLKNLFKVEAMFSDLDAEFQATRLAQTGTTQDIENALESILESSENTILDEIDKMLDSRHSEPNYDNQKDINGVDEETELLDDFQELAFSLRHKYSTVSDSTLLATEQTSDIHHDEHEINVKEDTPHTTEEDKAANIPESDDNLTLTNYEETPANTEEEQITLDEEHTEPNIGVEKDGGHFNKNKDNQPGFSESDEMQKVPQATLENPLDMGLAVEMENSAPGSLDLMEPVSEIREEEVGSFSTGVAFVSGILLMSKSKIEKLAIVMISLLPEEWKPGETFFGCPWQAVVITALVGVVTFTLFFWRTVLAIKKREYLVDERKLTEQIQALKKEKNDVLVKMSEIQKQAEKLKENQKQSMEAVSSTVKKVQDLESEVLEAEMRNKQMVEQKNTYANLLEKERTNSLQNQTRIEKLETANEKLQLSRKKVQEALAKTTVLLDEAKIREDARNVQQKCVEKDYAALKEENKMLKATIKDWEDKHMELSEQIKVYHKSQKELEDSLVLKDHNVEVLSELLADLDACDLQKGDTKVLANGEVAPDKKTAIKNRIKQMMDVSRVQTTLTVVEEERDRFMTKLLSEEKTRKTLEEQHQELEHAIATLKSEKSHVENQFKVLQQKNEIMVEMYQQKENALQQRLTKEELERRSKENMLSEVGGKALEVEEQVKVLRQRINEMEEQMKKTEVVYKDQIKEQENKTHSNWVNARNAERALNQEKLESSKLREKLAVLTSQLNERRAPLFRPNSGQPAGPRQGDSYGPSPVSGGAPSPPLMIEGPRRPPSAPVGRRIDPYGPRPPSDPHGRYAENKHISGMDMMGPRSSSPANMDGSTQAVDPQVKAETQAETSTESPEPGPGSFMVSPIRDSPGPMVQGPPPGSGPHDPLLPPGHHGRLPPPGLYRPPRPGVFHLPPGPYVPPPLHGPPLPANGHPGMPLPGPMGGEFGPRPANGQTFLPRLGPGPIIDPRGPLPPYFRPPLHHNLGPVPLPTGVRGPVGPLPPIAPDMRFPGPHDHTRPPMDLPQSVPPHPADAYGQAPPNALHNSVGAHSGPRQDPHMKQETPQDSVRPTMVKP